VLSNHVLDHSGAPDSAWFLALNHMCMPLTHVARKSLNWRSAIAWLLGFIPDITSFMAFMFWEGGYYREVEPLCGNTPEKFGHLAGISAGFGLSITFIIYIKSGELIYQSSLRSARHGGPHHNTEAEEKVSSIAPKADWKI
jgi:hypothetical protein